MKILIVEDEALLAEGLRTLLELRGFEVEVVTDGENGAEYAETGVYDLLILDVMMPGLDGLEACQKIRGFSTVPIIMLTARSEDADKLLGFESGADDYVTKPYNLQILLARIARVLQRVYETKDSNHMKVGEVTMDISKSMLTYQSKSVDLTKNELRIMHCLFSNKNTIVSREKLMKHMWDCDAFVDDNTLTVNINRLRKKLEYIGLIDFIETKRGLGYIIYEDQ